MEIIILILTLIFGLFVGFTTPVQSVHTPPVVVTVEPVFATPTMTPIAVDGSAQDADGPTMRVLAVVESVDTFLLESFPVQVQLHVSGYHQDGCEAPVEVVQRRDGNHVTVELYRVLPAAVMCPMVLQPLDETIMLEGGFEPGSYTIDVNGVTVQVEV